LDAQTRQRGPSAERGPSERRAEQKPEIGKTTGAQHAETSQGSSWRDRAREHSLAQTILAQRQQFHQSRLVEHAAPSDIGYQQTIDAMTRYFQAQGSNASDAASQAIAWVGRTLQTQIDLLAYIDVFWMLAVIGVLMVPLALIIKPIDLRAPPKGH